MAKIYIYMRVRARVPNRFAGKNRFEEKERGRENVVFLVRRGER